jgi:membrane-bound lytic murein transglycosylase D
MKLKCVCSCLALIVLFAPGFLSAKPSFSLDQVAELFPSEGFEAQIDFWKDVFTKYTTREVIFHDIDDPRLIYHKEVFQKGIEGDTREARRQRKHLRQKEKEVAALFDQIRRYGPRSDKLKPRHREIVKLLEKAGYKIDGSLLRKLRNNIRYQRGVRDKFRASLIRAGLYWNRIERTFADYGLPPELGYLPHVESSFDYKAHSRAGAAGIWQFTRGTGRSYLRINRYVDERLDPIRATDAAARLLKENFAALGNWPLAITSYNHGKNGMLRAKKRHGSDLRKIIRVYKSRYFGFASKNFYSEFLAALDVARNYEKHFGPLTIAAPLQFETVKLQRAYDSSYLTSVPGLSADILVDYNPHLRNLFGRSSYRILPLGIEVRVPPDHAEPVRVALESAKPSSARLMVAADGSMRYRVQVGDSLGDIAGQLGSSVRTLQNLNGIRNPNLIYPGQVLLVSRGDSKAPAAATNQVARAAQSVTTAEENPVSVSSEPVSYRVKKGDSLTKIAKQFGTSVDQIQRSNRLRNPNRIYPGMTLRIGVSTNTAPRQYEVRRGDTLERIARKFGTSVNQIQAANGIRNPNRIRLGQELVIP